MKTHLIPSSANCPKTYPYLGEWVGGAHCDFKLPGQELFVLFISPGLGFIVHARNYNLGGVGYHTCNWVEEDFRKAEKAVTLSN